MTNADVDTFITPVPFTPIDDIGRIIKDARRVFKTGRTLPIEWRKEQLRGIVTMLEENKDVFSTALYKDLHKNNVESDCIEIGNALHEAQAALKNLSSWAYPTSVSTPLLMKPGTSSIHYDPLGVVCIIVPFNFPINLALMPLIGALAAGNVCLLKPSEMSQYSCSALFNLLPKYVDPEVVRFVCGGVPETTELLTHRFDHIFYTGSVAVARIVMTAAAKFLTPVTLELGGKSPLYVDETVNIAVACRKICWSKFMNAGQVCIAPDYALVTSEVYEEFVQTMKATIVQFFSEDPISSPDFGRIINARHTKRVAGLLDSADILFGGDVDIEKCFIAPTLVRGDWNSALMSEEIFGPVLPILKIKDAEMAVEMINSREKPLALYIFSKKYDVQQLILSNTSSGSAAINECFMQAGVPSLPFGGVGESGMGSYHGKQSFLLFSHQKSVLHGSDKAMFDFSIRYPPYDDSKKWMLSIAQSL